MQFTIPESSSEYLFSNLTEGYTPSAKAEQVPVLTGLVMCPIICAGPDSFICLFFLQFAT